VADSSRLRVADSDREQLAAELREHLVAGRLTPEEFEERVGAAYRASTRAELDALREDLPMSPAVLRNELAGRRAHLRRRLLQEGGGGLTASLVCVAIWLLSGANGSFWPAWVIFFSLLPLLRDGWRLFGPAPELDAVERRLESRRRHGGHRSRRHHHGPPRPPRPPGLPR
jgi:uncharacterized membrane protein YccC